MYTDGSHLSKQVLNPYMANHRGWKVVEFIHLKNTVYFNMACIQERLEIKRTVINIQILVVLKQIHNLTVTESADFGFILLL